MFTIGGYLLTALAIAVVPRTRVARRHLASAVVLGGVAASVLVLVNSLAQGGLVRETLVGASGASDPNNLAASLLLPLALTASDKIASWPLRCLVCAMLVAGVLSTGSRGGVVGVLIVLGIVLNWRRRGKAAAGGVLKTLIVLAIVWVLVLTLFPGLLTRLSYAELRVGRLRLWPVGLAAFGRFGSIGAGTGSFPTAYDAVGAGAGVEGYSRAAHNIFLQIGVELGVPGLVLFCLVVFLAIRRTRSSRAGTAAILGVLAVSFLLGTLELSFFWVALVFPFLDIDSMVIHANNDVGLDKPIGRAGVKALRHEPTGCEGLTNRSDSSDLLPCPRPMQ